MEISTVEEKILQTVTDAEIEVSGADCDFNVTIISDTFDGMSKMKRQQLVLSGFTDQLASGELHALSINAFTFEEWNAKPTGLVQISL